MELKPRHGRRALAADDRLNRTFYGIETTMSCGFSNRELSLNRTFYGIET